MSAPVLGRLPGCGPFALFLAALLASTWPSPSEGAKLATGGEASSSSPSSDVVNAEVSAGGAFVVPRRRVDTSRSSTNNDIPSRLMRSEVREVIPHNGITDAGASMLERSEQSPVDCQWRDWTNWANCSATCGTGAVMSRTRTVAILASGGGYACRGDAVESKACVLPDCPTHCQWQDWSAWTGCNATCGSLTRSRTRFVAVNATTGGKPCAGSATDTQTCGLPPCPVACTWADWSSWASCTKNCGSGTSNRTREVRAAAQFGGANCAGASSESRQCNTNPCPVNCGWGLWSSWSTCTRTCAGGTRNRARTVLVPAAFGGAVCTGGTSEEQACNTQGCPVDCTFGPWTAWAACSRSCGGGMTNRTRVPNVTAQNGGKPCVSNQQLMVMDCNLGGCPVDCEWTSWSTWDNCTVPCGGGISERRRSIKTTAMFNGKPCGSDNKQTQQCNTAACPVNCEWSTWTNWTACSKSCGGGSRTRVRQITTQAKNGGVECTGTASAREDCNTALCAVDCVYSEWGGWTNCSKTCGNGTRTRGRSVMVPAENGGKPCDQPVLQADVCSTNGCPVACKWADWQSWSDCTRSCGGGVRSRLRVKSPEAAFGGPDCTGNSSIVEDCVVVPCPVDCKWGDWLEWNDCSVTCGTGFRSRSRPWRPAMNGGLVCTGNSTEQAACSGVTDQDKCPPQVTTTLAAAPTPPVVTAVAFPPMPRLPANTTGNLSRTISTIISNITSSITSGISGNISGSALGNILGNISSIILRNISGSASGSASGNALGNISASTLSNILANISRIILSNTTTMSGPGLSGNVSGNVSRILKDFTNQLAAAAAAASTAPPTTTPAAAITTTASRAAATTAPAAATTTASAAAATSKMAVATTIPAAVSAAVPPMNPSTAPAATTTKAGAPATGTTPAPVSQMNPVAAASSQATPVPISKVTVATSTPATSTKATSTSKPAVVKAVKSPGTSSANLSAGNYTACTTIVMVNNTNSSNSTKMPMNVTGVLINGTCYSAAPRSAGLSFLAPIAALLMIAASALMSA